MSDVANWRRLASGVGRAARGAGRRLRHVRLGQLRPHSRRSAGSLAVLLLLVLWWCNHSGDPELACWPRREILDAICMVESSGRDDPPDGDGGKAIGPYQIHRVYWFDANEFDAQLGGEYQHCRRRDYAERVIDAYMRRYAAEAWRVGDAETIARVHNGGPNGAQKQATVGYWQRVRNRLGEPDAR